MQKALDNLIVNLKSPIPALCWLTSSIICAAIGPFGTYETDPLWFRMIFWGGILLIATLYSLYCYHVSRVLRTDTNILKISIISITFFTLTYSAFILILIHSIYEEPLPSNLLIISIVGCVTATIAFVMYLWEVNTAKTNTVALKINLGNHGQNPLLSRINVDMGSRLIRLTMRDHYVEAHTCNGMQLIHMRFSDAVNALDGFNGMQVHRSHWVNLDEVTKFLKQDGKMFFQMTDGAEIPISRSKMKHLKELGILT